MIDGLRIPPGSELQAQATTAADQYMTHAVGSIDRLFGAGHAKSHPELVCAFVQAAALDVLTSNVRFHLSPALEDIAAAISAAAERLE